MNAVTDLSIDPDVYERNLAALAAVLPATAAELRAAAPPDSLEETVGRDGSVTFFWREGDGTHRWLGRTSMPSVSGPALVESFQPGGGNVLLYGMGQGVEAGLLLARLGCQQAVMAVEPQAWAAALVMRLHDFSTEIRAGRLLVFAGAGAWEQLETFLIGHAGYLEPQRVLSWPWFDSEIVADVTQRLGAVNTMVAQRRATARGTVEAAGVGISGGLALLSCMAEPRTWRLARLLANGAEQIGWQVESYVMDDPSRVHPYAIEAGLARMQPAMCLMIDTPPGGLAYRCPSSPVCVWWSASHAPGAEFLAQMGADSFLAVSSAGIRDATVKAGFAADRMIVIRPAACSCAKADTGSGTGIAVIADGGDVSAKSVGLNLSTHARLWDTAVAIVRERRDRFTDADAEEVLRIAGDRLKIRIDSAEVRQGILARMWQRLGAVARREYVAALHEAGVEFDLYGEGWDAATDETDFREEAIRECWRGPWPVPDELSARLGDYGTVVCMETSGRLRMELLDAMAAGLAAVVRRHPADATEEGLGAVLDIDAQVRRFQTRSELLEILRAAAKDAGALREMARKAGAQVRAGHTWADRLREIGRVCGGLR